MARNSSGTYSLPAGQPVVTGTTISSSTFNTLTSDIATELTDSLSRSAKGAMLGILQLHDGTSATVPDLTWSGDTDTGLGHSGANIIDIIAGGTTVCAINASGFGAFTATAAISTTVAGSSLTQTSADTALIVTGNRSASSTGNADVQLCSTATRTAGNLLDVVNNATTKLSVDFAGQIKWPSGPSSTSSTPAPSAVTALTPNTSWTSTGTPAYWKDPCNIVRLKGALTNGTGGATGNILTTNPLPAGFRPAATRVFTANNGATGGSALTYSITVTTTGTIVCNGSQAIAVGDAVYLDCISFLAEA